MKILIADDDPVSRHKLRRQLEKWDYDIVAVDTGEEAWRVLQGDAPPPLAILDWMMPDLEGIDLCRRIRSGEADQQDHYTYVVIMTVRDRIADLVEAMDAGADDFISKPYNPIELRVRVQAAKRILDLQRQIIAAREEFRRQAQRDPMTGVLNHQAILDALDIEMDRSGRSEQFVSCILADLDHFKSVNDTYGHQAGDKVLVNLAQCLKHTVRKYDVVGRYGGEEFMIVLPGSPAAAAFDIAERVREQIASASVESATGLVQVTISMGVASTEQFADFGSEDLIAEADKALYAAKHQGRNRVVVAKPAQAVG